MENRNVSNLNWCAFNKKTLEVLDYFITYSDSYSFLFRKGLKFSHKITCCSEIAGLRHERKIYLCRYHLVNIEGVKNSLFLEYRDEYKTKFRRSYIPMFVMSGIDKYEKKTCWEGVQWSEFYLFARINYPKGIFNPIANKDKFKKTFFTKFTKKLES